MDVDACEFERCNLLVGGSGFRDEDRVEVKVVSLLAERPRERRRLLTNITKR